jgi:hypothetical protein
MGTSNSFKNCYSVFRKLISHKFEYLLVIIYRGLGWLGGEGGWDHPTLLTCLGSIESAGPGRTLASGQQTTMATSLGSTVDQLDQVEHWLLYSRSTRLPTWVALDQLDQVEHWPLDRISYLLSTWVGLDQLGQVEH